MIGILLPLLVMAGGTPQVAASAQQPGPPATPVSSTDDGDDAEDLVVTGRRQRGTAPTTVSPEVQLSSRAIRAIGATSVSEVLEQLAPQLRSSGFRGAAAVLVNGRRVAQVSEVDDLPSEAISRIDVFPTAAAAALGFGASQRVVNIVLKRRYRAATLTGRPTLPIGDGRRSYQGRLDGTRINEESREAATFDLRRNEAVFERDAGGVSDRTRTVRPLLDRAAANVVVARAGATGNVRLATEDTRIGRGAVGLRTQRATVAGSVAINRTKGARSWSLSATIAADRTRTRTRTSDTRQNNLVAFPIATLWEPCAGACITGALRTASIDGYSRIPLTGGQRPITGTLNVRGSAAALTAVGMGERRRAARRSVLGATAGVEIPLTDDPTRLRLDAQAGLDHLSDAGDLVSTSGGLNWQPGGIAFDARYAVERRAATLQQIGDPLLVTPAVRLYDYAAGAPALAALSSGGAASLRPSTDRLLTLRAQWIAAGISLEFTERHSTAPVVETPAPTTAVQRAFPQRAIYDEQGALEAFDARPFNASRAERRELALGLNRALSIATSNLRIGVYHRWRWRDRITLVDRGPSLDLLRSDAIDAEGGAPRHVIEMNGSIAHHGIGLYIAGNWASAGRAASISNGDTRIVRPLRLDLRLLVDLRQQGWLIRRWSGATGTFNVAIDNVLNRRISLYPENGPAIANRLLFAGTGRTVRLTLRKRFR